MEGHTSGSTTRTSLWEAYATSRLPAELSVQSTAPATGLQPLLTYSKFTSMLFSTVAWRDRGLQMTAETGAQARRRFAEERVEFGFQNRSSAHSSYERNEMKFKALADLAIWRTCIEAGSLLKLAAAVGVRWPHASNRMRIHTLEPYISCRKETESCRREYYRCETPFDRGSSRSRTAEHARALLYRPPYPSATASRQSSGDHVYMWMFSTSQHRIVVVFMCLHVL